MDSIINVVLPPGQKVKITLQDTDGEFVVSYGPTQLTVESDLPDTAGRQGIIYCENFGSPPEDSEPHGK